MDAGAPTHSGSPVQTDRAGAAPPGWDELVAADGSSDYAHTAHWNASAAAALPGADIVWLTVRRQERLIAGLAAVERSLGRGPLCRHRCDCSLEGTSGGPLVARDLAPTDQDALVAQLLHAYRGLRRGPLGAVTMALGPERERRYGSLVAGHGGWRRHESPTAVIDLSGGAEAVARDRLSLNKRNERNRGLRRGARLAVSRAAADLAEYYPLYRAAAAHWGVTPTPLSFLQSLLADPSGRVFFICVRVDGRMAGGHLNLHLGDRVFAWNGVTDPACARTHFPATLCYWGDIEEACRRGARWLDVGASGGIHSLAGFKRYFGAESQMRGYYVDEAFGLRAFRAGRTWLGRPGPGRAEAGREGRRWHDGRDTGPRRGGGA